MIKKLTTILLTTFLIVLLNNVSIYSAGKGTIKGTIRDAATNEPLPYSNAVLLGTSLGTAADKDGKFVISNIPAGGYTLHISYIGYKSHDIEVNVKDGQTIEQDFSLAGASVVSDTVVVTAQAEGQMKAINEQLSSIPIKNVVSQAKIQELPDANAAESVGRLPGVSLIREGGEGSKVVIRGLSPQYNQVTIDGVEMPSDVSSANNIVSTDAGAQEATGSVLGDRGVDLSMISSNMLGGIEVIKAITPDMDAAVLGGVVNFDMRRASQSSGGNGLVPKIEFLSQGEYNALKTTSNNYKFSGTIEKRLFGNRFGIFAQVSTEKRNLSNNELGVNYNLVDKSHGDEGIPILNTLNLTDVFRIRSRSGGTVVLDYKSGSTNIGLMNFISNSNTKATSRQESAYPQSPNSQLRYRIIGSQTKLNVVSNLLNVKQDIPFFHVDLRLSHAYSESNAPGDATFDFLQQYAGFTGLSTSIIKLQPKDMATYINPDSGAAYLTNITNSSSVSKTTAYTAAIDFLHEFSFSDLVSAKIKFGGFYQYRRRSYDYNETAGSTIYDGGDAIITKFQRAYPQLRTNNGGLSLANFVYNGYDYGTFLNGDYSLAYPLNSDLMWQLVPVALAARPTTVIGTGYKSNQLASIINDYSGHEEKDAAYIMATVNIGENFTILPGVRYQNFSTTYEAARGISTPSGLQPPVGYHNYDTTVTESHGYYLPMVHLIYKPNSWLNIHFAYTNTLNYPGFSTVTPRYYVAPSFIDYNNYRIKPARSQNYDLVLSIYNNEIGLLTFDGFSKNIKDLIFYSQTYTKDLSAYPELPQGGNTIYQFNTYVNSPYVVDVYGIESNWQTHFWYLPGILSGLIFDINYSHIFSQANYPKSIINTEYNADGTIKQTIVDTFYTTRLLDQPNDVLNLSLGYDVGGFSARISMLYRNNIFKKPDFWLQQRVISDKFTRWDLSVRQKLPWYGIQLFFNLNNINGANDIDLNQKTSFPAAEQRYGMSADLGLRVNL